MVAVRDYSSRILVVDDEKLIRMTISAKLRSAGYVPVAVDSVSKGLSELRRPGVGFRAIITDIMMDEMDGFEFRNLVRGYDKTIPMFFMTALDPEEGSGFLKHIMEDPNSYYMPKSATPQVMLNRIKTVVASRRIEQFIGSQMDEQKNSLALAANIQRSLLPVRAIMTERGFYSTLWKPKDVVSGDLYEAMQCGFGVYLYVLGDVQGHGTSAALAMTAVQSFLKQFHVRDGFSTLMPNDIANMLQKFFRKNLTDVTYMTALICLHKPLEHKVEWISCGASDLEIFDPDVPEVVESNPEKRGGLPIGLMPDTEYSYADVVTTRLSDTAVCFAASDGIQDVGRDKENKDNMTTEFAVSIAREIVCDTRLDAAVVSAPQKIIKAYEEAGYKFYSDDVTLLIFGKTIPAENTYEATIQLKPDGIEHATLALNEWCMVNGWDPGLVNRIQLVMEEALMNIYDHGIDDRERLNSVASLRLRLSRGFAELTIWDCGSPVPSVEVAGGDSGIAFELKNRQFSGRGRGRLIMRELCEGIERSRYVNMNETVYHIPVEYNPE